MNVSAPAKVGERRRADRRALCGSVRDAGFRDQDLGNKSANGGLIWPYAFAGSRERLYDVRRRLRGDLTC